MRDTILITARPENPNTITSGTENTRLRQWLKKAGVRVEELAASRDGTDYFCILYTEENKKTLSIAARFFNQSSLLVLTNELGLYRMKTDLTESEPLGILYESSPERGHYQIGKTYYELVGPDDVA